jgi:hypothetical protein
VNDLGLDVLRLDFPLTDDTFLQSATGCDSTTRISVGGSSETFFGCLSCDGSDALRSRLDLGFSRYLVSRRPFLSSLPVVADDLTLRLDWVLRSSSFGRRILSLLTERSIEYERCFIIVVCIVR